MRFTVFALPVVLFSIACRPQEGLTQQEAGETMEEMKLESSSQALTGNTIEIATNFTIGAAVEQAADEIRATVESQLPCAKVTLVGNTLTIEYGALGTCPPYHGQVLTGTHSITVTANDQAAVRVDHDFMALSNGIVSVTGEAHVTWNLADPSRHVIHDLVWTRLSDRRKGEGSGDRIQRPLAGGLTEGFSVDGSQTWQGKSGQWDLDIDRVQMRWIDPVPQAGIYTLETPFDKTVSATFERKDADTIHVTISGSRGDYGFDVTSI